MAKFRTLDENGDISFGKGLNNYASENDAIRLDVKTRILSWVDDCFFDMQAGVDWYNRLGKFGQAGLLEQDIKNIILKTEGVREITNISLTTSGRSFSFNYDVTTIYSTSFSDLIERTL